MSGTAWDGFGWQDGEIPREPLDEATRIAQQLPRTLRPVPGEDVVQRPVFDPSLKHLQNAYRATDPRFSDPTRGASWRGPGAGPSTWCWTRSPRRSGGRHWCCGAAC